MYAGTDADGNKQHFYATVRGTGRKAEREAKQKEGKLLAKAAAGHVRLGRSRSTSSPTIGWQSPVTRSPLATTEIFLDRHVWPALGKKRIEKIGPADLNRLYLASRQAVWTAAPRLPPSCEFTASSAPASNWRSRTIGSSPIPRLVLVHPARSRRCPNRPTSTASRQCCPSPTRPTRRCTRSYGLLRRRDFAAGASVVFDGQTLTSREECSYTSVPSGWEGRAGTRNPRSPASATRLRSIATPSRSSDGIDGACPPLEARRPRCERIPVLCRSDVFEVVAPTTHRRDSAASESAGVKGQLRDLRNFHATLLLDDGFDIKTVSGRLTHARTSTTQDR